ncbi:beach domain-containing protein a2-related [Anaeramoeba flamelloides]|uniref:Beach domain-containing protein a2-related n=1 Tax=Anaeramoeba flamelloides TaxID=1746091 RepID=A0ABQ8X3P7_9EUKA|nr:beach domain-containing protein a2-related [Anaeramoeba flamelloides]
MSKFRSILPFKKIKKRTKSENIPRPLPKPKRINRQEQIKKSLSNKQDLTSIVPLQKLWNNYKKTSLTRAQEKPKMGKRNEKEREKEKDNSKIEKRKEKELKAILQLFYSTFCTNNLSLHLFGSTTDFCSELIKLYLKTIGPCTNKFQSNKEQFVGAIIQTKKRKEKEKESVPFGIQLFQSLRILFCDSKNIDLFKQHKIPEKTIELLLLIHTNEILSNELKWDLYQESDAKKVKSDPEQFLKKKQTISYKFGSCIYELSNLLGRMCSNKSIYHHLIESTYLFIIFLTGTPLFHNSIKVLFESSFSRNVVNGLIKSGTLIELIKKFKASQIPMQTARIWEQFIILIKYSKLHTSIEESNMIIQLLEKNNIYNIIEEKTLKLISMEKLNTSTTMTTKATTTTKTKTKTNNDNLISKSINLISKQFIELIFFKRNGNNNNQLKKNTLIYNLKALHSFFNIIIKSIKIENWKRSEKIWNSIQKTFLKNKENANILLKELIIENIINKLLLISEPIQNLILTIIFNFLEISLKEENKKEEIIKILNLIVSLLINEKENKNITILLLFTTFYKNNNLNNFKFNQHLLIQSLINKLELICNTFTDIIREEDEKNFQLNKSQQLRKDKNNTSNNGTTTTTATTTTSSSSTVTTATTTTTTKNNTKIKKENENFIFNKKEYQLILNCLLILTNKTNENLMYFRSKGGIFHLLKLLQNDLYRSEALVVLETIIIKDIFQDFPEFLIIFQDFNRYPKSGYDYRKDLLNSFRKIFQNNEFAKRTFFDKNGIIICLERIFNYFNLNIEGDLIKNTINSLFNLIILYLSDKNYQRDKRNFKLKDILYIKLKKLIFDSNIITFNKGEIIIQELFFLLTFHNKNKIKYLKIMQLILELFSHLKDNDTKRYIIIRIYKLIKNSKKNQEKLKKIKIINWIFINCKNEIILIDNEISIYFFKIIKIYGVNYFTNNDLRNLLKIILFHLNDEKLFLKNLKTLNYLLSKSNDCNYLQFNLNKKNCGRIKINNFINNNNNWPKNNGFSFSCWINLNHIKKHLYNYQYHPSIFLFTIYNVNNKNNLISFFIKGSNLYYRTGEKNFVKFANSFKLLEKKWCNIILIHDKSRLSNDYCTLYINGKLIEKKKVTFPNSINAPITMIIGSPIELKEKCNLKYKLSSVILYDSILTNEDCINLYLLGNNYNGLFLNSFRQYQINENYNSHNLALLRHKNCKNKELILNFQLINNIVKEKIILNLNFSNLKIIHTDQLLNPDTTTTTTTTTANDNNNNTDTSTNTDTDMDTDTDISDNNNNKQDNNNNNNNNKNNNKINSTNNTFNINSKVDTNNKHRNSLNIIRRKSLRRKSLRRKSINIKGLNRRNTLAKLNIFKKKLNKNSINNNLISNNNYKSLDIIRILNEYSLIKTKKQKTKIFLINKSIIKNNSINIIEDNTSIFMNNLLKENFISNGGFSICFYFLQYCNKSEHLFQAIKLISNLIKNNSRNSNELNRIHGYSILSTIIYQKRKLIDEKIIELLYKMIGLIKNKKIIKILLLNFGKNRLLKI